MLDSIGVWLGHMTASSDDRTALLFLSSGLIIGSALLQGKRRLENPQRGRQKLRLLLTMGLGLLIVIYLGLMLSVVASGKPIWLEGIALATVAFVVMGVVLAAAITSAMRRHADDDTS